MEPKKRLLEIRREMKGKKPDFIRQDIHKKARLERKWRKPRGLDSKIRRKLRGRAKPVSQGYRSPKKVRGLHKSGLMQKMIRCISDMEGLDPKENCLIISSSLGGRKRIEILKKSQDKNFEIVNIKNPGDYIKKAESFISLRKKTRQEAKEKPKGPKDQKVEKKDPQREEVKADTGNEDKRESVKKEKEKLLTKKEI